MHELQKLSLHRYRSECGGFGGGGGVYLFTTKRRFQLNLVVESIN